MEVSAIQPVVSPVPSAHNGRPQNKTRGSSTHTNKLSFSQTISSLKGIIRIPNRRKLSTPRTHFHSQSQDDADSTKSTSNPHFTSRPRPTHGLSHSLDTQAHLHSRTRSTGTAASDGSGDIDGIISDTEDYDKQQRRRSNIKNDPYARFSRTAEGLNYTYKPYMSQPMLGAELSRGTGGDELVTGYDSESGSASGSGYGGGGRSPVRTGEGGGRRSGEHHQQHTASGFSATSPLALPPPSPSPTPVSLSSPTATHPATEVAFSSGGKVEDTLIQVQHGDQGDEGEKEGHINDLYDGKAGGSLNNAAPSDTNTDTNTNTNIGTTANTAQSTTPAQISSSTSTPTSTIQTNSHARSNSPLPLLPLPDGPSSSTSASTSGAALRPRSSNGSGRTPAPRRALPPPPPESPMSASSSASAAPEEQHVAARAIPSQSEPSYTGNGDTDDRSPPIDPLATPRPAYSTSYTRFAHTESPPSFPAPLPIVTLTTPSSPTTPYTHTPPHLSAVDRPAILSSSLSSSSATSTSTVTSATSWRTVTESMGSMNATSANNNNNNNGNSNDKPKPKRPPPNHRFSMTFMSSMSSGAAPPVLPVLQLPGIRSFSSSSASAQRSRNDTGPHSPGSASSGEGEGGSPGKKLSEMPALPLKGTGRGVRGHEEVDDLEDDDEDGDEEEDEEEDESAQYRGHAFLDASVEVPSRTSFSSEMTSGSSEVGDGDYSHSSSYFVERDGDRTFDSAWGSGGSSASETMATVGSSSSARSLGVGMGSSLSESSSASGSSSSWGYHLHLQQQQHRQQQQQLQQQQRIVYAEQDEEEEDPNADAKSTGSRTSSYKTALGSMPPSPAALPPVPLPLPHSIQSPQHQAQSISKSKHLPSIATSSSQSSVHQQQRKQSPLETYFGDPTRPSEKRFSRTPHLPPVETSKLDLDFSFLDRDPAESSSSSGSLAKGKGKGKSRGLTDDAGRTPVGRRPVSTPWGGSKAGAGGDYFQQQREKERDRGREREEEMGSGAASSSSPVRTPRADEYHRHTMNLPTPVPVQRTPSFVRGQQLVSPPPLVNRSISAANRLSVNFNGGGLGGVSQHPGIYKQASRSLIDVHAVEKKERIEQMVREDEEAQEVDRRRKVKEYRMSLRASATAAAAAISGNGTLAEENGTEKRGHKNRTTMEIDARGDVLAAGINAGSTGAASTSANDTDPANRLLPPRSADIVTREGDEVSFSGEGCSASGTIGRTGAGGGEATASDRNGDDAGLAATATTGTATAGASKRISMAPAYDALSYPLRRRRSMPTFNATTTAPPPYPEFAPHPQSVSWMSVQIQPREDEGREELPPYSNSIKLAAIMPRKMEFSKPGIQAKDRKWRRVLCVLEGTMFKVYKAPAGASGAGVLGEWWESKVGVGDVATTAPLTTTTFVSGSGSGHSRRPSASTLAIAGIPGVNPGDYATGRGEEGVRNAIAAVEEAERAEEMERERGLMRARKSGEVEPRQEQTQQQVSPIESGGAGNSSGQLHPPALHVQGHHNLQHDQPSSSSSSYSENHSGGGGLLPATRSALNLAVQLLKPGSSRHARSSSDVGQNHSPVRAHSPRSSLNIPRSGRTTPTSSLPSRSPTPSPSVNNYSRPSTPATSVSTSHSHSNSHSASSERSGFRVGAGSMASGSSSGRASTSRQAARPNVSIVSREKEKEKEKERMLKPDEADLIRVYTMQNAESGLGSDYLKRKHVIRVRLEGEQFLLQAQDVDSVIAWIEGLQSATNIALDLDERPMPRGPIFPRRRRRRRVQPPPINTDTANMPAANPSPTGQTPVTASHLAAPLTRSAGRRLR